MDVVMNKDGTMYDIGNDTDFYRMLRDCLGEDAAYWYKERIGRIDDLLMEMRPYYPPAEEMARTTKTGGTIYDLTKVASIGESKLTEIATIAWEIPGWDE